MKDSNARNETIQAHLALARRVAARERAAAEDFARLVMPTVRTLSRRLTATESDANDAAQVALVEILGAAKTYAGRGSLLGWARTIGARAVVRWRVRSGTRADASLERADTEARSELPTSVIDSLPRPLLSYLDELPESQREALVLRVCAGCTIPEVSEITGAPVATVKSRISAGLNRLRKAVRRDVEFGVRAS